jgi:hypothetical protein
VTAEREQQNAAVLTAYAAIMDAAVRLQPQVLAMLIAMSGGDNAPDGGYPPHERSVPAAAYDASGDLDCAKGALGDVRESLALVLRRMADA